MTLKRFALYGAATLTALTLAACGGGDDGSVGKISDVSEIRDALSGTKWECQSWNGQSPDRGICSQGGGAAFGVNITDKPDLRAAMDMDSYTDSVGSVGGENWTLECGGSIPAGECGQIADELGGEFYYRGYWSDGDESDASSERQFNSANDIRDALVGTEWECQSWDDHSDTSEGNVSNWGCVTADNGLQKIQDNADTQEWADPRMDGGELPVWAIRIGHWGIDCYAKPQSKCAELANILGA